MVFSGDMVLCLFMNIGIIVIERIIFIYRSDSTTTKKRKKSRKLTFLYGREELNGKNEEGNKDNKNPLRKFYPKVSDDYRPISPNEFETSPLKEHTTTNKENPISSNNFQISPLKEHNTTNKQIATNERISLPNLKDLEDEEKTKKKQKKKMKKTIREKFYQYPIFYKFVLHILQILLFNYFILVLMPTGATNEFSKRCLEVNNKISCFYSSTNNFLLGFYFLYSVYFIISSFQIK